MSSSKLSAAERKKLQGMIDRTSKAATEYQREQARLWEWCNEKYGYGPGDIDADEIIDSVFGGSGESQGMPADEFHGYMIN